MDFFVSRYVLAFVAAITVVVLSFTVLRRGARFPSVSTGDIVTDTLLKTSAEGAGKYQVLSVDYDTDFTSMYVNVEHRETKKLSVISVKRLPDRRMVISHGE